MGIRVVNNSAQRVAVRLEKSAERSTRQLRRVHEQAAEKLAEVAAEMAPFKTGNLEGSITVESRRDGRNRISRTVKATAPYAIFMHEQDYNLGPGSVAKEQTGRFKVGRKYLERALQWLETEWGLYDRARRAVRSGIR